METPTPEHYRATQRPFSALHAFGFANATCWMIALGTPMVLLAGELGASTAVVGLAYAAVFLTLPIQILATAGLPRFGFKSQTLFGWASRSFFLLVPLGLSLARPASGEAWAIRLFLFGIIGFAVFRSIGTAGVMAWMYQLVPERFHGRFFSNDQSVSGAAGVLTLLFSAALFAWLPPYDAFAWQYGLAVVGSIVSVWLLGTLPDIEKPVGTTIGSILRETPGWCLRPSTFRSYLLFKLLSNLTMTAFPPFIAYYLKMEVGLPTGRILFFTALQYVGAIGGAIFAGRTIDSRGAKPFFRMGLWGQVVLMGFWAAHLSGWSLAPSLVPLAYLLFGASVAWWMAAHLKYLPRVCPEKDRALALSIHGSVVGLLGGVAPILWGFVLKKSDGEPGMHLNAFLLFLGISTLVMLVLFRWIPHLTSQGRELPSIPLSSQVIRSFRNFGGLINPLQMRRPRTNRRDREEAPDA